MTSQEIYDVIILHLRKQNSRSERTLKYWKRNEVECAVHGDNDKKDPIGALLLDNEYSEDMERYTFGSYLLSKNASPSLKEKFLPHAELIDACLFMHDFTPPENWEDELFSIAETFKLKYTKAEEHKTI